MPVAGTECTLSFSLLPHHKFTTHQRPLITEEGTVAGMSARKKKKKNETVLLHPQIIISSSPGHSKIKIKPKQDQNANSKQAINGTSSAFAEYKISPNCCQQRGAAFRITGKQHVAAWSLKRRGDCLIRLTLESPVSRTACVVPLGKMSAYI